VNISLVLGGLKASIRRVLGKKKGRAISDPAKKLAS